MTLFAEILSGPGTGKSTTSALAFGTLKQRGRSAELPGEFAKDLTWEARHHALNFQPYIFGKQAFREERIEGQVDVSVSDTSVLFSLLYRPSPLPDWYPSFEKFVLDYWRSKRRLVFFLAREPQRGYDPKGRRQTEEEALSIDGDIKELLYYHQIPYRTVPMDVRDNFHVATIVSAIEKELDRQIP